MAVMPIFIPDPLVPMYRSIKKMVKFYLIPAVAVLILCVLPPSAAAQHGAARPNILFCLADDASVQHFGAHGSTWVKTPAFDRIASQGLLFRNAYTPNAKCAPSRASILTGRNPWQLEELGNHLAFWPEKYVSVMELIEKNHYVTGYTGKGWGPGIALTRDRKPRNVTGKAYNEVTLQPVTTGIRPLDYAANFENFLEDVPEGRPFFFWFGSSEPHRAYEYGSGKRIGKKSAGAIDDLAAFWPDNDSVRNDLMDYAFEVEYFDSQVGRMVDMLERRGLLSNTLIVVTSDNGMPFPRVKGFQYEMSNHMPLAIQWTEGIRAPGRVIEDFVSFIDFAPTFLEVSGSLPDPAAHNRLEGRSLVSIFRRPGPAPVEADRDRIILGQERHDVGRPDEAGYPIRSIIRDGYMFIKNFEPDRWPAGNPETGYLNTDGGPTKTVILNANRANPGKSAHWNLCFGKRGGEELYHIASDPECVTDLSGDARHAERLAAMRQELLAALRRQKDPRMYGKGYLFDQYVPTQGRDFYKKFLEGERLPTGWVNATDYETDQRIIGMDR